MSSTHSSIASAIAEAFAAHSELPSLRQQIEDLKLELQIARIDLEDTETKLANRDAEFEATRIELTGVKDKLAHTQVNLATTQDALHTANNTISAQSYRISLLEIDLASAQTTNELAHAEISSLNRQLSDHTSIITRLRDVLGSLASATTTLPVPEVTQAISTFPMENTAGADAACSSLTQTATTNPPVYLQPLDGSLNPSQSLGQSLHLADAVTSPSDWDLI